MSSFTQERFNRDERVRNLEEERKEENLKNDAIVERMVSELQKQAPKLAIPTMVTKIIAKNNSDTLTKATQGFTPEQLKQLEQINTKASTKSGVLDSLEGSPFTKYIGEIAGALGVVQQIASSKAKAKESVTISDNLTKSIYHLQNGGKMSDITGALGAGNLKSMMGSAGAISAGSWLYDMATTGKVSDLTSTSLAFSNPGMMASHLAGGIGGLGSTVGSIGGGVLSGAGSLTGIKSLGTAGKALSTLDPTVATLLGTASVIGISIGANKIMNNLIKNSPLNGNKREKRWNLNHSVIKAMDNPVSMANYVQANNVLKQLQSQNTLSPAEAQMIGKLNEIAFYTSSLHDIYETIANKGTKDRNSSTRTLNKIDEDQLTKDMSGKELQNLFKDGKLTSGQISFLRMMEGMKYITDVFNPGTYIRSLSGKDTAPGQFKLREALAQNDPNGARKEFARMSNITLADVDLLHADIKERIASADNTFEGRLLATGIYSNLFLQLIATKMVEANSKSKNGRSGLIGELARLQEEQDARAREQYSLITDGMIKPVMKWMSNVPGLSALVPALHATNYIISTGTKAISGLSEFITNPSQGIKGMFSGITDMWRNTKDSIIDNLKPDEIKNENSIRTRIGAKALSLEDRANMYIANELPKDMQKLQWLMGSTEKAKVQDKYTGEFVDPEELKKRYSRMRRHIKRMTYDEKESDSYLDEFKNWGLKKVFGIKTKDIRESSLKNYSHVNDLLSELDGSDINPQTQSIDLKSRLNSTSTSIGSFSQIDSNIEKIKKINIGLENQYYMMMGKYIPLLKEIRDCVCVDCDGNSKKLQPNKNSINPLVIAKKFKEDGFNPFSPKDKIVAHQSMQENVKKSQQAELMEKFFKVYFNNLPYLEKIYKFFTAPKLIPLPDKKKEEEESGGGIFGAISGIGGFILDGLLDIFGFDRKSSGAKGALKTGGKALGGGMAGGLSRGLMSLALTLAKPGPLAIGAAIAAVAGVGIDYFFNNGEVMKGMWNSLKESSFGQAISGVWEKSKEFMSSALDFFITLPQKIADAISGLWEGTKKSVVNAVSNVTGYNMRSEEDISKEINLKDTNAGKLAYLNHLKNEKVITDNTYNTLKDKIIESGQEERTKKYGFSMTIPTGINTYIDKNFDSFSKEKQAEFIKDYTNSYNEWKQSNPGLNHTEYEKQYEEINKKISEKFKANFIDNRSDQQKQEDQKLLNDTLNKLQELSINNSNVMQKLFEQNTKIGLQTSKNLGDQIVAISESQTGIASILNITAKSIQKPNVIELDPKVINILPILKG